MLIKPPTYKKNEFILCMIPSKEAGLKRGKLYKVLKNCEGMLTLEGVRMAVSHVRFVRKRGTAVIKLTRNHQYRFNIVARNGEKIATSETYVQKKDALKTLRIHFGEYEVVDNTKTKKA